MLRRVCVNAVRARGRRYAGGDSTEALEKLWPRNPKNPNFPNRPWKKEDSVLVWNSTVDPQPLMVIPTIGPFTHRQVMISFFGILGGILAISAFWPFKSRDWMIRPELIQNSDEDFPKCREMKVEFF